MSLQPVPFKKGREHLPRLSKPYEPGRRDQRYWTDDELAIIRQYYRDGGASACLAHLPAHRTPTTVYQMAAKLGLTDGRQTERRRFTAEEDEAIRREWALLDGKKKGEVAALATRMGIARHQLSQRARKLGLTMPHKKEPPWTAAEDALMNAVPLHDPDRCADIFREHGFNRSPTAIMVRAKRVGISRRFNEGLSARQAAKVIGVDDKGITAYCISGDLKATKRDDNRLPQQGGSRWVIKPSDLRQFVIDYLGRIDFRKVDKFELVRLLTTEGGSDGSNRKGWTIAEDSIVRGGYARKMTVAAIVDELEASGFKRRSMGGVSARAQFLGCTSQRFNDAWSEREDQILRDAYEAGIRIADIVGILESEGFDRTRGAVQMRAIVLRISTDRVNYWTEEETTLALEGLRAGILQDLRDAGFHRGDTAIFKFAKKHNILRPTEPEWTEAEFAILRQRYDEKVPVKDIAAELGRKLQAVRTKASLLGLKQRISWTDQEYQILTEAAERGDKLIDTAARIGRPYPNVAAVANRMGLNFRQGRSLT